MRFAQDPVQYGGGGAVSMSPGGTAGNSNITALRTPVSQSVNTDMGKFSIDLTAPDLGLMEMASSAADFAGAFIGGIPGVKEIGGAVGGALGAVGSIQIGDMSYTGAGPVAGETLGSTDAVTVGSLLGAGMDVISTPWRALVDRPLAGRRAEAAAAGERDWLADAIAKAVQGMPVIGGLAAGFDASQQNQDIANNASQVPPDIQEALDAGTMTVDQAADEMVARGAGFSQYDMTNLTGGIVLDPMNLIGGAVGKGTKFVGEAGTLLDMGADANSAQRLVGSVYNKATHGLSAAQQTAVEKFIGPATSGIFRHYGTGTYNRLAKALTVIDPQYADALNDALSSGAAHMTRAMVARDTADELRGLVDQAVAAGKSGEEALEAAVKLRRLPGETNADWMSRAVAAARKVNPEQVERNTALYVQRVAPSMLNRTPDELRNEGIQRLAAITGMSPEEAGRVLGNKPDLRTLQMLDLATYAHFGDTLEDAIKAADTLTASRIADVKAAAKAAATTADDAARTYDPLFDEAVAAEDAMVFKQPKPEVPELEPNIDTKQLTIIRHDTLTENDVKKMGILDEKPPKSRRRKPKPMTADQRKALDTSREKAVRDAVDRFESLREKYAGTDYDWREVRKEIVSDYEAGVLPRRVEEATFKNNLLAEPLSEWRNSAMPLGYDLGFKPKTLFKIAYDDAGNPVYTRPFVEFQSSRAPLTQRNWLGRVHDAMFRGVGQQAIILDSAERFVRHGVEKINPALGKAGLSEKQWQAIHRAILQAGADAGVAPRGLVAVRSGKYTGIEEAFLKVLDEPQLAELKQVADPTYLVMRAFQGNLRRVGLTQYLTGGVKRVHPIIPAITDFVYPMIRFRFNPMFQAQEVVESPFLNTMRGIAKETVPDDVAKVYAELGEALPDFKYLTEAGYYLHLAGSESWKRTAGVGDSWFGRATSRFANVAERKSRARIAQVMGEHGDEFKDTVQRISPPAWRAMEIAYGTTDAKVIAQKFMLERLKLTSGNIDEAMEVVDAAKPRTFGTADEETVWQAFRESFRQSSLTAFKTHYFNPERGWLERSINHMFLGIYPVSYMWGKVLPEYARFLLKRPFGLNAPLSGQAALLRVQQQMVGSLADPETQAFLEQNPDTIRLMTMLVPGMPSDLPANAPLWARRTAVQMTKGNEIDEPFLEKQAADMATYQFGLVGTTKTVMGVLGEQIANAQRTLEEQLDRAAAEYDGQFPLR